MRNANSGNAAAIAIDAGWLREGEPVSLVVRRVLAKLGINNAELARRLGLSGSSFVSSWLGSGSRPNNPSPKNMLAIIKLAGPPPADLDSLISGPSPSPLEPLRRTIADAEPTPESNPLAAEVLDENPALRAKLGPDGVKYVMGCRFVGGAATRDEVLTHASEWIEAERAIEKARLILLGTSAQQALRLVIDALYEQVTTRRQPQA